MGLFPFAVSLAIFILLVWLLASAMRWDGVDGVRHVACEPQHDQRKIPADWDPTTTTAVVVHDDGDGTLLRFPKEIDDADGWLALHYQGQQFTFRWNIHQWEDSIEEFDNSWRDHGLPFDLRLTVIQWMNHQTNVWLDDAEDHFWHDGVDGRPAGD
jgi:hypothetical protein